MDTDLLWDFARGVYLTKTTTVSHKSPAPVAHPQQKKKKQQQKKKHVALLKIPALNHSRHTLFRELMHTHDRMQICVIRL